MVWWVRSDPCGVFSASFTVFLVLYAQVVIVAYIILPWYGFCYHAVLYTACSLLSIISHSRAQFSDPGSVPRNCLPLPPPPPGPNGERPPPQHPVPRVCRRCMTVRPQSAHHCSTCGRCVIKMDHHCPWVNNCVAIFNQKYFLLFLFYTSLCCIYSGVLLVARFISCTHNLRQCSLTTGQSIMGVLNFVEALIFGLFVIIMLFDQLSAIFESVEDDEDEDEDMSDDEYNHGHGHGGKRRSKHSNHRSRSRYDALKGVFGEPFTWRWFLPLNIPQRVNDDFDAECSAHLNHRNHQHNTNQNHQHQHQHHNHNHSPNQSHHHSSHSHSHTHGHSHNHSHGHSHSAARSSEKRGSSRSMKTRRASSPKKRD